MLTLRARSTNRRRSTTLTKTINLSAILTRINENRHDDVTPTRSRNINNRICLNRAIERDPGSTVRPLVARSTGDKYDEDTILNSVEITHCRRFASAKGLTGPERETLQAVRMAELIDQPLATFRLLHDPFLVVLSDAAAQLVVVHGRPILPFAPEPGHAHRVLDLEHTLAAVEPAYTGPVNAGALQQLLQELPQVNVRATVAHFTTAAAAATARSRLRATVLVLVCKKKSAFDRKRPGFVNRPRPLPPAFASCAVT